MLFDPDSPEYVAATQPDNSSTPQEPGAVARATSAAEVVEALTEAGGRVLVPQATGHGAGAHVGSQSVILDTSGLDSVEIDAQSRTARVGAGTTWSAVNNAAEPHGLLGPAGSSPSVSVSGYTFGGGIGWMARAAGLASDALRRVEYVDGTGRTRIAADDADDADDREALWSFRGAGGVGIATHLEIDLVPVADLHAGTLLWPVAALPDVVAAWADALGDLGASVASSIGVLHVPPEGPFPQPLLGQVAVHLAIADPHGPDGAADLLAAVRAASEPVLDTWGPADAERLAGIHLDPQGATPALGDARWLDAETPRITAELLGTAAADDSPLVMMELRHLAGVPAKRDGATTRPSGPFVFHAVGALGRSSAEEIAVGFAAAREVWQSADVGLSPGSWLEGAGSAPDALAPDALDRARRIADRIDPDRRVSRSRLLGLG